MPTLLLTAFEPFGGEAINPSWQVAEALHGQTVDGGSEGPGPARIQAWRLPCVFGDAARELQRAIDSVAPDGPALVLALGQAGGRSDFSLERVAINVDDARIADNAGARPVDEPVVAGGPAAYFATLPIKAMVAGLRAAGLPASVSNSAGTYVCNHVFYALMHALHALNTRPGAQEVRGGFMHLPFLPEQVARQAAQPGAPSLPLATLVQGVHLALGLAWAHRGADLRASGGTEA